jgi:hypothetical protein
MNTPSTKPPVRYSHAKRKRENTPTGTYIQNLEDEKFLLHLGAIASRWPQVEELMTNVLGDLLGVTGSNIPLRQLYRSIVNAKIRIDILRNLLQRTQRNADKGPEYDELIDEFAAVNKLRNKYLHGLWSTHQQTGATYFAEPSTDDFIFLTSRKIEVDELEAVLIRVNGLHERFVTMLRKRHAAQPSSPETPPQPPGGDRP